VHTLALDLEPEQILTGWRPGARLLFVPALSDARPGDRVAVRIGIAGHPIRATIFGRVSSVRRVGRPSLPPGAELATDPASAPALTFLAAAARGEEITYREREPRWLVTTPVEVLRGAARVQVPTANLSGGGCALKWDGSPPVIGDTVRLKLRGGLLAPTAEAVVCWTALVHRGSTVGLRLVSAGLARRAWRKMAAAAERSGASFV
jgi:hypothetical protein